jgi:transposase InsO family protein
VATIWRTLSRRGFVTPQPHKRPKSSWRRFQAELPNECWQADTTHWPLADGADVEILNIIDDHSRLLVASRAFVTAKAADVVETFHLGAAALGLPASMLTDNGAIFTAQSRRGACAIELELSPRRRLQALPPLPPSDLRQSRTLPSDVEEMVGQTAKGPDRRRPPAALGPLRRLLQHRATAPGARPPHPRPSLHRQNQSHTTPARPHRAYRAPSPPRPHRQRRQRHPSLLVCV